MLNQTATATADHGLNTLTASQAGPSGLLVPLLLAAAVLYFLRGA